jgi:hypothetical protein
MEIPKAFELCQRVFSLHNANEFDEIALEVYHFQFANNYLYADYCRALGRTPDSVTDARSIPFLPISFYKTHRVETTAFDPAIVFHSSGTTGNSTSNHYLKDPSLYQESFRKTFERFYGPVGTYCILGLLPSYLEREGSSLVYMVDDMIRRSGHPQSGFYLNNLDALSRTLDKLEKEGQRVLLIGVTYALLDFAAAHPRPLKHTIIMETGGMKGRQREMVRAELYQQLREAFSLDAVHSEYGMTELLSQAYAINGIFETPPWMQVWLRDETDPLQILDPDLSQATGAINVVDLANLYSCAFIATDDVGKRLSDGRFEVLGRMDHSDLRGCSLLAV